MSGPLFNRQFKETQASPDHEAIDRGPKGGASGEEVEVIAPPRMDNDFEWLLLGTPPSAINQRPTDRRSLRMDHSPSEGSKSSGEDIRRSQAKTSGEAKRRAKAVRRRHLAKLSEEQKVSGEDTWRSLAEWRSPWVET
jgi:hypothetical protein